MSRNRASMDLAAAVGRQVIQSQADRMIAASDAKDVKGMRAVAAEMARMDDGEGGSPWSDCGKHCEHLLDEGNAPGYAVCYWACVIRGGPDVAGGFGGDMAIAREARSGSTLKEGSALKSDQVSTLAQGLRAVGSKLEFGCVGSFCICSGDRDCNDMFSSGKCGDGVCFEDGSGGVVCLCRTA